MSQLKAFGDLLMNLIRKPVTVEEEFGFMPDTFRWFPQRNDALCTGCGACYERCSSGATHLTDNGEKRTVTVDGFNCIYCGRCAEVCPEHALELTFEAKTLEDKAAREESLQKAGRTCETEGLTLQTLREPGDEKEYTDRVSLNRYADESAPTTDTTLSLQRCTVCGEIMPVTEKHLLAIKDRTLRNLKPETAAVIEKDMEMYLTACIVCRQKHSLEWNTHPRKWI